MTIRTIEEFNDLKEKEVHGKYLPVSLAGRLPSIARKLKVNYRAAEDSAASCFTDLPLR